jgi:hypothetical protein
MLGAVLGACSALTPASVERAALLSGAAGLGSLGDEPPQERLTSPTRATAV